MNIYSGKKLLEKFNPFHIYHIEELTHGCVIFVDPSLVGRSKQAFVISESKGEFEILKREAIGSLAEEDAKKFAEVFRK